MILMPVGPIEEKFAGIGCPLDRIDVLIGLRPDVNGHDLPGLDLQNSETRDRIRITGFRVSLLHDSGPQFRQAVDQIVVAGRRDIEGVKREEGAVGRPPHRGVLIEFFAVDPAGGPEAIRLGAVDRDRYLVAVGITEPDVVISMNGRQTSVGRWFLSELPSSSRTPTTSSSGRRPSNLVWKRFWICFGTLTARQAHLLPSGPGHEVDRGVIEANVSDLTPATDSTTTPTHRLIGLGARKLAERRPSRLCE